MAIGVGFANDEYDEKSIEDYYEEELNDAPVGVGFVSDICYERAIERKEEIFMPIKLWVDDVRPTPEGYTGFMTTNAALRFIHQNYNIIDEISLDHDAGDCVKEGGDYINILKEMERLSRREGFDFSHIKFYLHSANPVGVANMRAIIEKNGWKEIK
jgi:hypothetical protein